MRARFCLLAVSALFFCAATLTSEENLFNIVKPGMSLRAFNAIEEIPLRLKGQKVTSQRTTFGVTDVPTSIQSKYFNFKVAKEWQGGIVRYQNNRIQQFSLFHRKASSLETGNILRQLMGNFEKEPSFHPFRSFGKDGLCFAWSREGVQYNFNCYPSGDAWFYQIDLKKSEDLNRTQLDKDATEVVTFLKDLGFENSLSGFNVAAKDDSEDDLLNLLQ